MAKESLPLYLRFAVYSYVDMLSLFNLACAGFCEMSELLTVPCILIGNRQLPPDTTSISLFELWPQSASVADIEQSEAARANDADIKLVAPTMSAEAATLDNCIVAFFVFMKNLHWPGFPVRGISWPPNWTSGWRMEQPVARRADWSRRRNPPLWFSQGGG